MKGVDAQTLWLRAFERAPIGMAVVTSEGAWLEVNPRLLSMFGLSPTEIQNFRVTDILHPDDRNVFAKFGSLEKGELPLKFHSRYLRGDRTTGHAIVSPTRLEAHAQSHVLLYIEDVTDQKKAEASLMRCDRMVTLGTIASGVAHEINNPLAYVTANLELVASQLRQQAENGTAFSLEEVEELIREARQGGERVRRIVRELKMFSRVDDERRTAVELTRVLELSVNMAFNEVRHRARIVKDYGAVPVVYADESRLAQVIVNLLINASQAIPEGSHRNEIRIATKTHSSGAAIIEISDTGCGIPENILQRIFEPFFTTKEAGVGTGLGLAICRDIIAKLGGSIAASSIVGRGSIFTLVIPVGTPDVPRRDSIPPSQLGPNRRGRILVVDDEPLIIRMIQRILSNDHAVIAAENGLDAISRIEKGERFDVILCDLMMPEITGMDLYARIRNAVPSQAERMLFLTGGAFSPRAREFLDQIANPWIEKPFDSNNLRALVKNIVNTGA